MTATALQTPETMQATMASLNLHGVKPTAIPAIYDLVMPLAREAEGYWRGRMTADHILNECMAGKCQLWVVAESPEVIEAIIITELVHYPNLLACRYVLISGSWVDSWLAADEVICAWAKERGATLMEAGGRRGWHNKARKLGYEGPTAFYEKEL